MSLLLNKLFLAGSTFRTSSALKVTSGKSIHSTFLNFNRPEQKVNIKDCVNKDRSQVIPVETSIRYLQSKAYEISYGTDPVWKHYRRNYKGQFPPKKTRATCIRGTVVSTGSPCPICRDEYLIIDYRNIDLLKQFISEYSGEILSYERTGLCQRAHRDMLAAIIKAKEYGLLRYGVTFRDYDYNEWKQ